MELKDRISPYAALFFEKEELCMLMWALEVHCDLLGMDGMGDAEGLDHDLAYSIHQRIQKAWQAIL